MNLLINMYRILFSFFLHIIIVISLFFDDIKLLVIFTIAIIFEHIIYHYLPYNKENKSSKKDSS